jgi:hypothetical protein
MGCCGSKDGAHIDPSIQQKPKKIILDKSNWESIKVGDEVRIMIHEHVLKRVKIHDEDDEQWLCDGTNIFHDEGGCKAGMTEFGHQEGVDQYSCDFSETCDFDFCRRCIQYCLWKE